MQKFFRTYLAGAIAALPCKNQHYLTEPSLPQLVDYRRPPVQLLL